ncbi:MAG: GNAT family N-acetyltransferase [Clostridium sp.]|nr:GNAT family N-acetyltransferase [Clostridium sp.]
MIKIVDDEACIYAFDKTDLFSIRIKALLKSYGTSYDFASFYVQYIDSHITAVLSKLDNDFTVSYTDDADINEIWEFVNVIGYNSVLCDYNFSTDGAFDWGDIMVTKSKTEIFIPYTELDEFPKLMDLFNYNDYDAADFESWYVDISHRVRHNTAKAYTLKVNDEIISSGIFSSIYNNDAVLTAVQTEPQFRRMGYGSALVSAMIGDIKGKVYLMREHNKNEEFYKKLGFINIGKWRMYK